MRVARVVRQPVKRSRIFAEMAEYPAQRAETPTRAQEANSHRTPRSIPDNAKARTAIPNRSAAYEIQLFGDY